MSNTSSIASATSRNELREVVRSQLKLLLEEKNYEGAKTLLVPVPSVDIAEAIEGLPETLQLLGFRLLKKNIAVQVYEYLPPRIQQSLIKKFQDEEVINIVNEMSPDKRAKLFDELPPKLIRKLLNHLSAEERQATDLLLGYGADTAGRIMTPKYIALKEHLTAIEAQKKIRTLAQQSEVSYYLYVTDEDKHLIGLISLKDLIICDPKTPLREIMTQEVISADTETDQEEVAKLIQRYDLLALPIVDKEKTLLGVVTVDDIIDVLELEATEDIYKMGGLDSPKDDYFEISLFNVIKQRSPWVLLLLVTNSATVMILSHYEVILDQVVALAFFTPLLIGAGGNVGAQSSTVVIRGLSTEGLKDKKPLEVVIREFITGGLLGMMLGVLVIVGIILFLGQQKVSLTVGISLLCITIIAATTGATLPYLFMKLGFDPALMSSPLITTVVDILGIFIYLNTARFVLGI
ncbi:Mg2+ transporter [Crocosphaera subtropica ATCC 51142]|uniref:Magnesium transporter MgtE n=1 Tax=Crocosphaera subtropica (strain ATCC 51142 / BH68) TaxID=43989 RepID=B1WTC3_CROS5|nr:magnesium transporter [Crocosphaera subtropica]ACB52045.1 Mg2+ transporter [Crocosphaera subtropica ATCC 51142]